MMKTHLTMVATIAVALAASLGSSPLVHGRQQAHRSAPFSFAAYGDSRPMMYLPLQGRASRT